MKNRDIVLIEDEESWRSDLARWLQEADYNVRLARNQKEALTELKAGMIGVAVVDMSLFPGDAKNREGWTIAQEYANANIPVVVVSAYLKKKEVSKLHSEGLANWYFDKRDFNKDEFLLAADEAFALNEQAIKLRWHQIEKRFRVGD